jgi:hypothetical protein
LKEGRKKGRMGEERKGKGGRERDKEDRQVGREGGRIYNFYLKLLLDCQQQENQECYVILYNVSSSVSLRYLKQQRTDLENVCVQVVQCNAVV